MTITAPLEPASATEELEDLLARMRPGLHRYCASRLDRTLADDVLSEVFHAAVSAGHQGRTVNEAWLMGVARNKVIDQWRKAERGERLITKLRQECPLFDDDDPQLAVVESEVETTLGRIAPRQRRILVRYYVDGLSLGHLAREDGVSYRAMESALARARAAFRRHHR